MKIAIINITGGGMSGGYKEYLKSIIPRIATYPEIEKVLCMSPKSLNIQDWFQPLYNVKFINCKPFKYLFYGINPNLKRYLEDFSPDVIFIPVERFLRFKNVPTINMVQNMEPFVVIGNNLLSEKFRMWIQKIIGKNSVEKSDRTIVLSKYSRDLFVKRYNISANKIGLIYHGISLWDKDVYPPKPIPREWDNHFLFTAGSIRPARGIEDILHALKYFLDNSLNIPNLIIAGETIPRMSKYKKKLENWIQQNNLSSKIYWAGKLNKAEMNWCYRNCQAFIMTSRVESFGMIALESIANGCFCISSDSTCLPEILDNAAIFYPSQNPKILARKINEVLNWPRQKKQEMYQLALKRTSYFNWDKCVGQIMSELKKVINESKKVL